MSPLTDHTEITEKFKEILKANGISEEVASVDVRKVDQQDGMLSQTQHAKIKFVNPTVKELNLFVKVHTTSPTHSAMVAEFKAFEKEALFLSKYVPAAREFCKSKGMEEFVNFYPKCYYGDKDMIVLENLVLERGLVMLKQEDQHDLEAATFAIKTLAKHDALSHAMIQEAGGEENFFRQFPNLNFDGRKRPFCAQVCGEAIKNNVRSDIKLLEVNDVPGAEEAILSLKSMEKTGLEMVLDSIHSADNDDEALRLLNHGDYWNNNLMYRKDPSSSNITDCLLIDFQMTNYNVPALDLSYYFFSSVKTHVRQAHMKDLLNLYLETLAKFSSDFGHPVDISFEKFFAQFRKRFAFGYFWGGICMSCGPGLIVQKNIDMNTIDMKEWAVLYDKLVNDWIESHPEEGKRVAEQVVQFVQEYSQLLLK